MQGVIVNTRLGNLTANEGAALHEIAFHKDPDGNPLDETIAAVELINAIRPIVAISTYIAFMARWPYIITRDAGSRYKPVTKSISKCSCRKCAGFSLSHRLWAPG